MAITSAGYDGTVDEVQFAGMLPKGGASEYGVDKPGDFKVTIMTGAARAVSIAPGTAWGHSVVDVMDTNFTVQFDPVTSGTRYDMVVLRRNWQPPGGATTVVVIKGGSSHDVLPKRENKPGVLDDQPLAIVALRAGDANVLKVDDLRCWGRNGGVTANDNRVLQYLTAGGTDVLIDKTVWRRQVTVNGNLTWVKPIEDALEADSAWQNTPNTSVRRNANGNTEFNSVWLKGPQPKSADAAVRKDYVDEMVTSLLDVMPKTISGNVTITPKANTPTSVTVKFPVDSGWFSRTPNVVATPDSAVIGELVNGVSVDEVTRTGCRLWINRTNTTPTKVYWIATA